VTATSLNASSISSPSPHEVRQTVYEARFERTTKFNPLEPPKVLFNDDYTKRFSTIIQASKLAYNKVAPVLDRNNTFSIRAPKDCFRPSHHRLWQNKSDKPFVLRELTIGGAKLSGIKSVWKVLCTLDPEVLTLDFGNSGQPSIWQATHDPMQTIARILRTANICLEAELPSIQHLRKGGGAI